MDGGGYTTLPRRWPRATDTEFEIRLFNKLSDLESRAGQRAAGRPSVQDMIAVLVEEIVTLEERFEQLQKGG
jgi:hypothetical protein